MYPKSSDKYPYKKREGYKQTQRGGQCEDRGRDWSDSSASQGTPKSAPGASIWERHMERILVRASSRNQPCQLFDV